MRLPDTPGQYHGIRIGVGFVLFAARYARVQYPHLLHVGRLTVFALRWWHISLSRAGYHPQDKL